MRGRYIFLLQGGALPSDVELKAGERMQAEVLK